MILISWLAAVAVFFQGLDAKGRYHTVPLAQHVTLSLSSDQATYYRGQALRLRITAENASDVPIAAYLGLNPTLGDAKVYYQRSGVAPLTELDVLRPKGYREGPGRMTLHPGKQRSVEVSVSLTSFESGARRFVLDQLGRYEFRVRHTDTSHDPNGVLESNVLTVEVVEPPTSEHEAQAAYTPDLAFVAHGRFDWLSPEETRAAAAFVERYPDSRYTPPVKAGILRSLEYRERMKQASNDELRLYENLTANMDRTPRLDFGMSPLTRVLWPADNAMVPITMVGGVWLPRGEHDRSSDIAYDEGAHITLESITCDDSCDIAGDVAGANVGTDDREFELRADRGRSGVGRKYTITYSATNAAGKSATSRSVVRVPGYETPPAWSDKNVVYDSGEPVNYRGEVWRCVGGALGRPELAPSPTTRLWVKVAKGKDWDFPVRYMPGHEVTHLGLRYRCLQRHISRPEGAPPSARALWAQIP